MRTELDGQVTLDRRCYPVVDEDYPIAVTDILHRAARTN
jgi:hypothetical protein